MERSLCNMEITKTSVVSVVTRSDFRPALALIWVSPQKRKKVSTFRRICHHCMWVEAVTKTLTSIQPASSERIATGAKPGSKEPQFLSTFSVAVLQFQRRCGREAGTHAYISLSKLCPNLFLGGAPASQSLARDPWGNVISQCSNS